MKYKKFPIFLLQVDDDNINENAGEGGIYVSSLCVRMCVCMWEVDIWKVRLGIAKITMRDFDRNRNGGRTVKRSSHLLARKKKTGVSSGPGCEPIP